MPEPVRPPVDNSIPTPEEVQALFPELEIIGLVARGGMGAIYQVRQPTLDRFAALKILPRDLAAQPGFPERFHREARTMAALNHPNIVTIHESGERDGLFFLLMEYVDGGDLGRAILRRTMDPCEAFSIIRQICEALQYAHHAGVIHRDIKPGNILLDSHGRVKVADFGISKIVGEIQDSGFPRNYLLGTPGYMAPEQRDRTSRVDQRADIYSLGAVFYELLTGKLPSGNGDEPPSKHAPINKRIDEVISRAMAMDPALRYPQAADMLQALERITRPGLRPAWLVAAGLILGAFLIAGAIFSDVRKLASVDPYPPAWENSLGMRFRRVPGTEIRMSIWETRVRDWQAFEKAKGMASDTIPKDADPNEPVAIQSETRQREFCAWLTDTERQARRIPKDRIYRLPCDHEWSLAAGLKEPLDAGPQDLHLRDREHYPWGTLAPVPPFAGNYPDSALRERIPKASAIPGYYDGHAFASKAGAFPPNAAGFHDLGGNLWEAVTTGAGPGERLIYRGGSWFSGAMDGDWTCLLSSFRAQPQQVSTLEAGFRIVLAPLKSRVTVNLLAAARAGDLDLLQKLFVEGTDLQERDARDRTALHLAAAGGHAQAVAALIAAGADVQATDQGGDVPLHAAAAAGCLPAVEALVNAGAKANTRNRITGMEAVHYAAAQNHPGVLAFLTKHGADLQSADGLLKLAPIHHAAIRGANDAIKWLVAHSVPVDAPAKTADGSPITALGFAIIGGKEETTALLLQLGASTNPGAGSTTSPLVLAAMRADVEIVRMLLSHGADPKARGLGRAVSFDFASQQIEGFTNDLPGISALPLQWFPAMPGQRDKVIRLLVERGMPLEQRFPSGFTPLLNAAYRGNVEAVQTLLDLGGDPSAVDDEGFTALHSAAEQGFLKVVELLLARGVRPDVPNRDGRSALDCAAIRNHHEIVARLIDAGASPEGLPGTKTPPATTAAQQGHYATLKVLIERGASPNHASETDGMTPLIAAAAGHKALVAPPGQRLPATGTEQDYLDCARILLDHGADPRAAMNNGNTALHSAADFDQTGMVTFLLDRGLPADCLDHKMFTPLHRAAQRDSVGAAAILLDRGASIAHSLNPSTPLHVAAAAGSLKTAALLLERGADPNLRDGKSATPLHWAVALAQAEMVALLVKHKADLAARDFCYNTPLHAAIPSGNPEILRILLEAGADPDLRNIEGATAMDMAAVRHLEPMVLILSNAKRP